MFWPLLAAVVTGIVAVAAVLKSRFNYEAFPEVDPAAPHPELDLTIVLPARDEQGEVGPCIRSLGDQQVLVADDHSTDRTSLEASEAGARVLPVPPLPKYWLGKANACWAAAQEAGTTWLLFVDADTRFAPGFVSSLLEHARGNQLIGASVLCRPQPLGFLARTLTPYAMGVYFTGISAGDVNHPLRPTALAGGECFLIRRDAYQFLQGHRAVASQVLDGLALARLMKRHRMKYHLLRGEQSAHVAIREFIPTLFRLTSRLVRAYPGPVWVALATAVCLAAWGPVILWLCLAGMWEVAAAYSLIPVLVWAPWYGWANCWRVPLAIYLFTALALYAAGRSLLGKTTDWKGRPV